MQYSMQAVTRYVTPDGQEFATEDEARHHLVWLQDQHSIERFMAAMCEAGFAEPTAKQAGIAIRKYLTWIQDGIIDPPKSTEKGV